MSERISFGRFHLYPVRRVLLDGDEMVRLGSRAFDILVVLARKPGQLVSQKELLNQVWPGLFVEEANLRVQIAAIRKSLGVTPSREHYISTVPGRGYCFVADVAHERAHPPGPAGGAMPSYSLILQPFVQIAWRNGAIQKTATAAGAAAAGYYAQRRAVDMSPSGHRAMGAQAMG